MHRQQLQMLKNQKKVCPMEMAKLNRFQNNHQWVEATHLKPGPIEFPQLVIASYIKFLPAPSIWILDRYRL